MKNKILKISLLTFISLNLFSCNNQDLSNNSNPTNSEINSNITSDNVNNSEVLKTFTITWKNYDGSILEVDNNVTYGSIPTYDGLLPKKESSDDIIYIFDKWSPTLETVSKDMTYTATFKEFNESTIIENAKPTINLENKTVTYGLYPQSLVSDETIIAALKEANNINNWYYYDNEYYTSCVANVYNNENYTFNNNTKIENGKTYYFKCEPIKWNILSSNNNTYYLLSSVLLDCNIFYENYLTRNIDDNTIYPNNYEYSNLRTWLNNEFYNTAFALNNLHIQETLIDNSSLTTDNENNKYSSSNTNDKVFLPSYQDYLNNSYGFDNTNDISNTRQCKTTDYARVKGAFYNKDSNMLYNGSYWTRSPSSKFNYTNLVVNSGGYISNYVVDNNSHCIRPSIIITI